MGGLSYCGHLYANVSWKVSLIVISYSSTMSARQ